MTEMCKANPCCGNIAGDCDIPLPQDESGFPARNTQWEAQIKAGAKSVNEARAMVDSGETLPGLPVPKKAKTSAEAMKEATAKISDSLDEAREALRAPFIKFAEDIKALEPLFEVMNEEHAKRVLAFLEAASNGMGVALQKEMENAFS